VCEQLGHKVAQQANVVWEKCEDLASLKCKFPSLLNAKEDKELFYDKEKVRRPNLVEPMYVHSCCLRMLMLIHPRSHIVGLRIKSQDDKGDLVSLSAHHDAVVRPKECAATIIAQVDCEMARIKDRDHHWEDGIEVCPLTCNVLLILTSSVECLSAPADHPSSAALQMDPPI
jgi:enhancer of polycomb-like protein